MERWLPVVGHEGVYEVSNIGRVRSIDHVVVMTNRLCGTFSRTIKGRLRKLCFDKDGYAVVSLHGKQMAKVHVLVAEAFIGARPDGMQVRHIDGVKTNNTDANLQWGMAKENIADKERHGTMAVGERNGKSKIDKDTVLEVRERFSSGESLSSIARSIGYTPSGVKCIVDRKVWRHV